MWNGGSGYRSHVGVLTPLRRMNRLSHHAMRELALLKWLPWDNGDEL